MPLREGNTDIQGRLQVFRQALARLGWSEGTNVRFDERWTTDNMEMVRAGAANLVESNPDVIITIGDRVIPILASLTSSIPIVIPGSTDLAASGATVSLARPGPNLTGFSLNEFSVVGETLDILKTDRSKHLARRDSL